METLYNLIYSLELDLFTQPHIHQVYLSVNYWRYVWQYRTGFFLKRFIFCNNIYHISIDCVDQLWVRISIRARCTTLCDNVCQWLATGWWFFPGPPVSSTNKTERHYITEILLKKALNTNKQKQTNNQFDDLDQIVLRKCLNK